jgi:protein-S-isoprenylcysteine O-methyltransferase Ste14
MPSPSPPDSLSSASSISEVRRILADCALRAVVAAWFLLIAATLARSIIGVVSGPMNRLALIQLAAKHCLFCFVVIIAVLTIARAPAVARAKGFQPFLAAFLGTNLVFLGVLLLKPRDDLPEALLLLSAFLVTIGNALAVIGLRHLGRSFSILAEARTLVRGGPYRWIRHPLYAAEFIAVLGVLIQYASIEAGLLVLLQCGCQVLRMRNEEALLARTFPDYAAYRQKTARILPGVW